MSKVDTDKVYSDLSSTIARLRMAGYDESELEHLDPTSWEFQNAQRQAIDNAQAVLEEPVNPSDGEVKGWYKDTRSLIQSSSRVLIMSLIELVRGLFPFVVMIALLLADGVRLFHSIDLLVKDIHISTLLAVVGILAYVLLVYRKAEATYNFIGSNNDYQKWSLGITLRDLGYRFSLGGKDFTPKNITKAESEYRSSKADVSGFKTLMFALIVLSPLLDPAVFTSLVGNGAAQINLLSGQISGAVPGSVGGVQVPAQIILSVFLNAFLTIKFLSMLDSNIIRAYALYADRDGDQARGQGYFLEQQRQYRVKIEEVSSSAQSAFLKQKQQEAKLVLARAAKMLEERQRMEALNPGPNGSITIEKPDGPMSTGLRNRAAINGTNVMNGENNTNQMPDQQPQRYQVSPVFKDGMN